MKWPHLFTTEVDHWLAEQSLHGAAAVLTYRPPVGLLDKVLAYGVPVLKRLDEMTTMEAGIELDERLRAPLDELHAAFRENPPDSGSCPVCGTDKVDWFARLAEVSRSITGWSRLRSTLATALHELEELARSDLGPLLAAARELAMADASLAPLDAALRRVATARAGSCGAVTAERRAAARELADIVLVQREGSWH
ncbi:MAG: hypothetical protein ACRDRR_06165 [Pseudonocardiaceae bacterium]